MMTFPNIINQESLRDDAFRIIINQESLRDDAFRIMINQESLRDDAFRIIMNQESLQCRLHPENHLQKSRMASIVSREEVAPGSWWPILRSPR